MKTTDEDANGLLVVAAIFAPLLFLLVLFGEDVWDSATEMFAAGFCGGIIWSATIAYAVLNYGIPFV